MPGTGARARFEVRVPRGFTRIRADRGLYCVPACLPCTLGCGAGCGTGYTVHGIVRRSSSFNTGRIEHLYQDPHTGDRRVILHYGDLSDSSNIFRIVQLVNPDEVYNLAAQSHVQVSFQMPEYTADVDALGTLRLLDACRYVALTKPVKFYQASTSELYGKVVETPQSETTPFYPRSPYAVAKLYSFWLVVNYREAYNLHASNGILFNHESPRRGPTFVTRKITMAVARIDAGIQKILYLGNLDAKRDWGHARDYVKGMWMILQAEKPADFVLATGETHTVREFCNLAFSVVGVTLTWQGEGVNEHAVSSKTGDVVIRIDPAYFRPTEVDLLLGNPTKALRELGWQSETPFESLVREMVEHDVKLLAARGPEVRD